MADTHNHIFFGQNTGLIISSSSKFDPYLYFRCIKKKTDGKWEKPSLGEGKVIKFTLEELILILKVLNSLPNLFGQGLCASLFEVKVRLCNSEILSAILVSALKPNSKK